MQVLTREVAKPSFMMDSGALAGVASQAGLHDFSIVLRPLTPPGLRVSAGEPDRDIYPASMLKTPLAMAALALASDGAIDATGTWPVNEANMTANDKPSPLVPGYLAGFDELLDLAITRSDNVATNMLFDIAGRERASALVRDRFGLTHTAFHRKLSGSEPLIHDPGWDSKTMNRHPAGDAARAFELIARGSVPGYDTLRRLLQEQQWNHKLSMGLQAGDRFAHKTGDTDTVTHDGGVLDLAGGRSFVLAVYTGMPSNDENNARFGTFMASLRTLMER